MCGWLCLYLIGVCVAGACVRLCFVCVRVCVCVCGEETEETEDTLHSKMFEMILITLYLMANSLRIMYSFVLLSLLHIVPVLGTLYCLPWLFPRNYTVYNTRISLPAS